LVEHALFFERSGGHFSGAYVETGQVVRKGDLLAEQFFYHMDLTLMEIEARRRRNQLEDFDERFAADYFRHTIQIEDMRTDMYFAEPFEAEIIALRVEILEIQLEQFLYTNASARLDLVERLEEAEKLLRPEPLYAPVDGIITFHWTAWYGAPVVPNQAFPPFRIVEENAIQMLIRAPSTFLRYGNTVTVNALDETLVFDARVVEDPFSGMNRWAPINAIFRLAPADPGEFAAQLAYLGLTPLDLINEPFWVETHELLVRDALTLPPNAIRQEGSFFYVLVYDGGRLLKRYITQDTNIDHDAAVILTGLEEGQRVVLR
jgi:hypothetical protein